MDASKYVKPTYGFKEIMELQKLPLTDKVAISCEALRRAFVPPDGDPYFDGGSATIRCS